MTETSGMTTLVASSLPPRPTSSTAISAFFRLKMEKGHCGQEFEIAHGLPNAPFHRFRAGYDFLAADHPAVDSDPFPEIDQIRRGVKPGPEPRRGQQRGRHRRHGAFAVGAGDQHGGAAVLGIAKPLQEGTDRIESETDSQGVQRL